MPGTPQPAVYQVYNPLSREEGLNSLLEALDFPASSSYTYQGTDGELVVRNGYDTLRVSAQGTVRYHTTEGEISRYPVASDTGGTGCYEAVEACRVLGLRDTGHPVRGRPAGAHPCGADHGGLGGGVRLLSGRRGSPGVRGGMRGPGSWCRTDRSQEITPPGQKL